MTTSYCLGFCAIKNVCLAICQNRSCLISMDQPFVNLLTSACGNIRKTKEDLIIISLFASRLLNTELDIHNSFYTL